MKKPLEQRIKEILSDLRPALEEMSLAIYRRPEGGLRETFAAQTITNFLKERNFEVHLGYPNLPTAFSAISGSAGRNVVLPAEYDALPQGHACGHHLISLAAVGAFCIAAEVLQEEKVPGRVTLVGTPAEEGYGGKVILAKQGFWKDFDACILSHPFYATRQDKQNLAVIRIDVTFLGKAAHAATAPWEGVNALDAMTLLLNGIGCYRQQMPKDAFLHGFVSKGGDAANIIPGKTSGTFYLRALTEASFQAVQARFSAMIRGAALMTQCRYRTKLHGSAFSVNKSNSSLQALICEEAKRYLGGIQPPSETERISTDFANVSQEIPGVNFFFGIIPEGGGTPSLHSEAFLRCAGTQYALAQAEQAACLMAHSAIRLLTDDLLARQVASDFELGKA
ncbi:MAG: M20 family metallopeptidase [Victivallaceae bacterium]|nr:M20 family metallopeptidase [Victivallaceae bacterium]